MKGRGATITDIQGREYIDGLAGLWNTNVGHGREERTAITNTIVQ